MKNAAAPPVDSKRPATDNALPEGEKSARLQALDMFQNLLARTGWGSSNLLEATDYPLTRISNNYILMQSLYRSNWIAQRVADTYPEEMCKIPPELTCQVTPKDESSFDRAVEKNGVWRKLEWTMKLANIFGGAGAIIVIKGHENYLNKPLDFDDIRPDSFRGIIPFDRWSGITPNATISNDIDKPLDYGLPDSYRVTKANGGGFDVHASRILRFTGKDLPLWEQQAQMYWGESLFEAIFEELRKRDNTSFNIVSLMFRAQILGIKIPELAGMLSGATMNAASLQQFNGAVALQSQLMSNQGLAVFGKDGGIEQHTYSFGGIADVYREFMKDIAAASEIPFEILFGRESGMGDNGEGSLQIYYDRVAHKQSNKLNPALEKLYPVIAMSTWGEIPKDFAWKFPIARTVSNEQRAELADKLNKPVIEAFNAGLISQKTALLEFQQNSDTTGVFSNITNKDIAAANDKVEMPMGEMGGGGEEGGGAFGSPKVKDPKVGEPEPTGKDSAGMLPIDCDFCGDELNGDDYLERGSGKFACPDCAEKIDAKAADARKKKNKAIDELPAEYDAYHAPMGSVEGMKVLHDLNIVIETHKGQRRRGQWWRATMPSDYGYVKDTTGADGDEMDCYVGPYLGSRTVYIVDQNKSGSNRFDEHKCFLGYPSIDAAQNDYLESHTQGAEIFRNITAMPMGEFKKWMKSGNIHKPISSVSARAADSCISCQSGDCVAHGADAEFSEGEHPRDESGKFALKAGQSTEQAYKTEAGEWKPERKDLHNKIIESYFKGKKPVEGGPDAYILGGGSASGKSTSFNSMYAEKFREDILRIDSDLIKEELPEYAELKKRDPENAARLVHEESSHLAKQMMAIATAKKIDILYDSTGAGNGIQGMAKTLHGEGYKVHVVYFDIPIDEARRRAAKRATTKGRHIPEEVLQETHKGSAKNFIQMHQHGKYMASMHLWDNTERIPALVYTKPGAESGIVVDGKKWKAYQEKAGTEE